MLLRKFVLYLFVLLQGLSPLLHAHAGTTHHGGIHMPDGYALADAQGQGQALHAQTPEEPPAITVETSLEARGKSPIPDTFSLVFRMSDTPRIAAPPWVPVAAEPPPSLSDCHRIPSPCAPPRV